MAAMVVQRCLFVIVAAQLFCALHAIAAAVSESGWQTLEVSPIIGNGLLQANAQRTRIEDGTPERLCGAPNTHLVTKADMGTALSLGTAFMLQSQLDSGHFSYEYDWKLGHDATDGDAAKISPVREAGAAWGLALIGLDTEQTEGSMPPKLAAALRKTLDFFETHSKLTDSGLRLVAYPGLEGKLGDTGTLAILTLANIDYLRTKAADERERAHRLHFLRGLLDSLREAVTKEGLVHKSYSLRRGIFLGDHTPYYDGEALLALTKAAKYLGFSELWPVVHRMTHAGWRRIVRKGLQEQQDMPIMKGYYQWSSMAWHELLTSKQAGKYAEFRHRLVDFGLWMVEVHGVARRSKNTGYAFEGLIPAYLAARQAGLQEAQGILGCAIDNGMRRVTGMQLGHPMAMGLAAEAPVQDRTKGGVQNSLHETGLRIDTTQHQMHAVIMMKRLLSGHDLI